MICKPCACQADVDLANAKFEAGAFFDDVEYLLGYCELEDCKGHEDCKGCDCQHLPVKEGQIVSS